MILHEEMNFTKLVHSADERIPIEAIKFGVNSIYELLKCLNKFANHLKGGLR